MLNIYETIHLPMTLHNKSLLAGALKMRRLPVRARCEVNVAPPTDTSRPHPPDVEIRACK